jgi:hypothetical protein
LLLGQDPSDDLFTEKRESAARPDTEVRQPCGNVPLPYGPDRAAEEFGYLADCDWLTEPVAVHASLLLEQSLAQLCARQLAINVKKIKQFRSERKTDYLLSRSSVRMDLSNEPHRFAPLSLRLRLASLRMALRIGFGNFAQR